MVQLRLVLKSGEVFTGEGFGAEVGGDRGEAKRSGRDRGEAKRSGGNCGDVIQGEVVFQTGMVGYVEALTDPSYCDQILVLTYPIVGNYGVPDVNEVDTAMLFKNVESGKIWVKALVVNEYVEREWSHWAGVRSLGDWLRENDIVGISGVDTRQLTKIIREGGTVDGQIHSVETEWVSGKGKGEEERVKLVDRVSCKEVRSYCKIPLGEKKRENEIRVLVIDCGVKISQLRCLFEAGADSITVVPWNWDWLTMLEKKATMLAGGYNRIFISNGPGDPMDCWELVERIRKFMVGEFAGRIPIFGICLGHQILSLAMGAKTYKLKYGNRGHNIPCKLVGPESEVGVMGDHRCVITSQNHGYAVDASGIADLGFRQLFVNANDGTNEGVISVDGKVMSVQFHPEGNAGPLDSRVLWKLFLEDRMKDVYRVFREEVGEIREDMIQGGRKKYRKVLILGSGGLSIGQSGEFDYSGSQAIKAYKEEGLRTVLINPNVATVQTSPGFADKVYYLPLQLDYIIKVIKVERPDCISISFGGQTALNCGVQLWREGILERYGMAILGSPIESVMMTEDRDAFKKHVIGIGEEVIESCYCRSVEEAEKAVEAVGGFPVLVRAEYALGGLGSGFANNWEEYRELLVKAFSYSEAGNKDGSGGAVIVDRSLVGWKEFEYEVVRDAYDNVICVCNMENIDPLGVHTGESMVVAPSQTLDDRDYNRLRTTAIEVIRSLGIVGECNIQYALDPNSRKYYIVEVNARLSRSSALASKATGYPLAYVAAKLSLGYSLTELRNGVTGDTSACFEPSLDYCVVKVPRWDLAKFPRASTVLDSSMKSVGEAMAIGRGFEETFQKAIRMAHGGEGMVSSGGRDCSDSELSVPTYLRIFKIADRMYHRFGLGYVKSEIVDNVFSLTGIDRWFLWKMMNIMEHRVMIERWDGDEWMEEGMESDDIEASRKWFRESKRLGYSDRYLGELIGEPELTVRQRRIKLGVVPAVKQIDTVAGEFPCRTNYLYTTYEGRYNDVAFDRAGLRVNHLSGSAVMVLGSGCYRIGSSVEFDWCGVNCVRELREMGQQVIVVNCNPETVSTDYDEADKLYFEELTLERVLDIWEGEWNCYGMVLAMGGQIPNNMAMALHRQKVRVIGTSPEMIDSAENRFKFSRMLDQIGVDQPRWKELVSLEEAKRFCDGDEEAGYPCLIRPSYVLSGAAMNVAYDETELVEYLGVAGEVNPDHPVVISQYIDEAKEIEVDAVARSGDVVWLAVSEHVENAGVHSGDSTLIHPAIDVTQETRSQIERAVGLIAGALKINGPFNIQFMAKSDRLYVIECNLRVSRSFPFVSKTCGVNMVRLATRVMIGKSDSELEDLVEDSQEIGEGKRVGVKVAQFSFSRLKGADFNLGVDMVSTGEVACFGKNRYSAYLKALMASDIKLPVGGGMRTSECSSSGGVGEGCRGKVLLSIGGFKFKAEFEASVRSLLEMGYKLYGTTGTADYYRESGWEVEELSGQKEISDKIGAKAFQLVVIISKRKKATSGLGYAIRRGALDNRIPLMTDIKSAKLLVKSIDHYYREEKGSVWINTEVDCMTGYKTVRLPGLIDVHVHFREPGGEQKEDWESGTCAALAGGVTMVCAMPNTDPAIVDRESFELVSKLASEKAHCDYGIFVGANSENWGAISELRERAAAMKFYLNCTYGPLLLKGTDVWIRHFEAWKSAGESLRPICLHAEGDTLAAALHAAWVVDCPVHVCHIARRAELELVMRSREKGQQITCEVSPHHLFFCREEIDKYTKESRLNWLGEDPHWTVCPRIGSEDDRDALWENLDSIDCFATDHAPHLWSEKTYKFTPGFAGLETALPLLLTAVSEGRLTLEQVVEKYHTNPKRIFGLPDQEDTYIEVDMNREWVIPQATRWTKADWTPFAGRKVVGEVQRVVLRGKVVFVDGEIISDAGYGQNVRDGNVGEIRKEPVVADEPMISPRDYFNSMDGRRRRSLREVEGVVNEVKKRKMTGGGEVKLGLDHLLSVEQLDRDMLKAIYDRTDEMVDLVERDGVVDRLRGKVLGMIFYEPSTRTKCSFSGAMKRLGGRVIEVDADSSSAMKGESFSDFVRCIDCYTDAIVIRNKQAGNLTDVCRATRVPIINAGDGVGEHPTQALLDIYTIRKERGTVNGLTIALVGDLKHGRTVHSLAKLASLYEIRKLVYVSPEGLEMPDEVVDYVARRGVEQEVVRSISEVIDRIDVLYMTRIQKERFSSEEEYLKHKSYYVLRPNSLIRAKSKLVILHPLPRVDEISPELDSEPRSAYFRQMENGMYVRMALLDLMLGGRS